MSDMEGRKGWWCLRWCLRWFGRHLGEEAKQPWQNVNLRNGILLMDGNRREMQTAEDDWQAIQREGIKYIAREEKTHTRGLCSREGVPGSAPWTVAFSSSGLGKGMDGAGNERAACSLLLSVD